MLKQHNSQDGLTTSFRCLVCDLAYSLGLSETEFYDKYDLHDRAQLIATYRSKIDRQNVMATAPAEARG